MDRTGFVDRAYGELGRHQKMEANRVLANKLAGQVFAAVPAELLDGGKAACASDKLLAGDDRRRRSPPTAAARRKLKLGRFNSLFRNTLR